MESHDSHEAHAHHITPIPMLLGTIAFLAVLMVLTVWAAQWHMPIWIAQIVALIIATAKAVAVVSIFMGVKWGTRLIKVFAIGGFVWMLLLGGMYIDYFTRDSEPVPGWEAADESALPRAAAERNNVGDEVDVVH